MGWPPPLVRVVHADEIGREDRDVAVDKPLRRVCRHEWPLHDEARLLPVLVDTGPADRRGPAADLLTRFFLRRLEVGDGDRFAVVAVGEVQQMTGKDHLLERHLIDGLAVLVEMTGRIDVGAAMLRHQDHLAFSGQLAAADLAGVFEGFQRPEGAVIGAEIWHVVVVLVAEIDDLLEIRLHGLPPLLLPRARTPSCADWANNTHNAPASRASRTDQYVTVVQLVHCDAIHGLGCNPRARERAATTLRSGAAWPATC